MAANKFGPGTAKPGIGYQKINVKDQDLNRVQDNVADAIKRVGEVISPFNNFDFNPPDAQVGAILYRGEMGWVLLPPGNAGQVLTSQGAGAAPIWA